MPSHFKYRIKKASENDKSQLDCDYLPPDVLTTLSESGIVSDSDKNILPATCAFIQKAGGESSRYLCAIRIYTSRIDLIASDQATDGTKRQLDGSGESRVSGALNLSSSDALYTTHFKCKYIDDYSATTLKEGTGDDETVLFPMCNCYTPRGGMAVTFFDGAVKGSEATGYPLDYSAVPNLYDKWDQAQGSDPFLSSPIPAYYAKGAKQKFPSVPPRLGFLQIMLNARAKIVPCCWWQKKKLLIYKTDYFRLVDLAVAQEAASGKYGSYSKKFGVSDIADYTYTEGDYYYPNEEVNYMKNILLGRNYDPSLPDCGNNQRFIYILNQSIAGVLTNSLLEEDTECDSSKIPWHFDTGSWFSPRNCAYPDCSVRYRWGSVCNGGGGFDLAEGKACPYYENPLMGSDEDSDRACKLSKMYPGDSITGAAILELMWLSKGGLPWTQEEWESAWSVPYIWSTMPFNPTTTWSDTVTDETGTSVQVKGMLYPSYQVYAVKTYVDLSTGKIKQNPPKLLPGGSITQFNRSPDGNIDTGDQAPDLPTTVQKIELSPIGAINIMWPVADFSIYNLSVENPDDYMSKLQEAKNKSYTQLVWGPDGTTIAVIGYSRRGQYENGVYCVNTALLIGEWKDKRERLLQKLYNLDIADSETQELLRDLWRSLLKSQMAGEAAILDGMELQKSVPYDDGTFIFEAVPLNLLYKTNTIIVFGFNAQSTIDVTYTKVDPKFLHGYIYQSETSLMTGWKTVWTGRPSVFLNETSLTDYSGDKYADVVGRTLDVSLPKNASTVSTSLTGTESLRELMAQASLLASEISTLNTYYAEATDSTSKERYMKQILSKQDTLAIVKSTISSKVSETSTSSIITNVEAERLRINGLIQEKQKEVNMIQNKLNQATQAGYSDLSSYYTTLVTELKNYITRLQNDLTLLGDSSETVVDSTSNKNKGDMEWCVEIKDDKGDSDTDEGGNLDDSEDENTQAGDGSTSRLYVPFLNSYRKKQRDIDSYKRIRYEDTGNEQITLEIPNDSGLVTWKYFEIKQNGVSDSVTPLWTYAPNGLKRVVVYTTRDFSDTSTSSTSIRGEKLTDQVGKWYTLPSCSSLIVLVLNPAICNRHNEFMIYSLTAEVETKTKDAQGNFVVKTKKIKFAPFNYSQVSRSFPGYVAGKKVEEVGSITKYGVSHRKICVSEDIEVIEKAEGNRHPWVIFAVACTEDSDVQLWPTYNDGRWYPGGDLSTTPIPQKFEKMDLYIEYAYIAEMYDQDDRKFLDWEEEEETHKTRILFNHPKAGTVRSVFTVGDGEVGEIVDDGVVDGFSRVPIGSSSAATIWPYARLACRDYEIHYIWRNNYKGRQVTEEFFMSGTSVKEPRECTTEDKRYTSYAHGDHELGTTQKPKITLKQNSSSGFKTSDFNYSWNTGGSTQTGNPTDTFPAERLKSCTPKNTAGPLYYPYTRSEPHSKFVPIHSIYIWDFLAIYRNKPKKSSQFGGFRFMASDCCKIGPQETRQSVWETYYYLDEANKTDYMGRSKTRGPLFQLEYEDYEEKKPRTIYLVPFATRVSSSDSYDSETPNLWTYYVRARSTDTEEWIQSESTTTETTVTAADNPDDLTRGVWKAICRSLYQSWADGDTSAYYELERQKKWGEQRNWIVNYGSSGLVFPDEEAYTPSAVVDDTEEKRQYLTNRISSYNDYIASLEETRASLAETDVYTVQSVDLALSEAKIVRDGLQSELDELNAAVAETDSTSEEQDTAEVPTEEESTDIDFVTGCDKTVVKDMGNKGSFFFDSTYIPGSVSSSSWETELATKRQEIEEELQKQNSRYYTYEQKSFGTNLPWSPYDSPPLFGNTGREMFIVELCTIGSIISWVPITDKNLTPSSKTSSSGVPSWWTSRMPEGSGIEMTTLLAPPLECTRALSTMSSDAQNPFYNYIFPSAPFNEELPNWDQEHTAADIRLVTQHDTDYYGKAYYRSDVGRLTLTPIGGSNIASIKVLGDTPATKESSYSLSTSTAISEGNSQNAEVPNSGDVAYDKSLIKNFISGGDIRGLAIESGEKTFVGHYFPGYYSPYVHGRVFVAYQNVGSRLPHWVWPKSNRNKLTRGIKIIKWYTELSDLDSSSKSEPKVEVYSDRQLNSISWLKSAQYRQKNVAADDGFEQNMGPVLKKLAHKSGDRETRYDETYYAIIVESERELGGQIRPPLIWAEKLDNKDSANSPTQFKKPKDGTVAYKVTTDGDISPVSIGQSSTSSQAFSNGYIYTRTIKNTSLGGNFITIDTLNSGGQYPAFEVGPISYRLVGKIVSNKDYVTADLQKTRIIKTKNKYGYNCHLVEATLLVPNLNCDILSVKISFKDSNIEDLFVNSGDGGSLEVTFEGIPVPSSTGSTTENYTRSYLKDLPLDDDEYTYYDVDFGICKYMKIYFKWYISCQTSKFDVGPWKGDDVYNNVAKPENYAYLSNMIDKMTLTALLPGKCVEVIKIEEAKFVVSYGSISKKEDTDYNFFAESKADWYKCQWEESEKNIERNWDQTSLYETKDNGDALTDTWTESGYEAMKESLEAAGVNYNKNPKAQVFENSCVELPELPQSRLKIEAWENYRSKVDDRDWTWGGVWTTRIAGPEWRTVDPYPTRDFIWWPAPHYYKGEIIMKGRAWLFGEQYKDEAKVMSTKREVADGDEYNELAYKNEVSGFDSLLRNIQEFESEAAMGRASALMKSQTAAMNSVNAKQANAQSSLDRMYSSASARVDPYQTALSSLAGGVGTGLASLPALSSSNLMPTSRDMYLTAKVSTRKEFVYLDEVGLSPEKVDWSTMKNLEEEKQKGLYNKAIELKDEYFSSDQIVATAIIPYYDWESIMQITGKEWQSRNGKGDFEALTSTDIKDISDDACTFKWKTWEWDEVQSFTFRNELPERYKMNNSEDGLFRRCGQRWKIMKNKTRSASDNKFREAMTDIDAVVSELTTILSNTTIEATITKINSLISALDNDDEDNQGGKQIIQEIQTNYTQIADELWAEVSAKMPTTALNAWPLVSYTKNETLIKSLENIIKLTRGEGSTVGYIDKLKALRTTIRSISFVTEELIKLSYKALEDIKTIQSYVTNFDPRFVSVKQKMEYYKNVVSDLVTPTRTLVGDIYKSIRQTEQKIKKDGTKVAWVDKIDGHSEDDDLSVGSCDSDGYPQKWVWDTSEDKSSDWVDTMSDDSGITLKRYDPWWRY